MVKRTDFTVFEICAGAGGQAIGLEQAGFLHMGALDNDPNACATLRANREKEWPVLETDVRLFDGKPLCGTIDLLAGGVPCPPFSVAGRQLGRDDERDLFPQALRLVEEIKPKAVMLENVRGFKSAKFDSYRTELWVQLHALGYNVVADIFDAAEFGVPQYRKRFVLVALRPQYACHFEWPKPCGTFRTVGETLGAEMQSRGWRGADPWRVRASRPGPTIVGGSKKHGGADLGPTRAKEAWAKLGIDGMAIALQPPDDMFPMDGLPQLTNGMVAIIQGFPRAWRFSGKKTAVYRQIGNAFPPPMAKAIGLSIIKALR